MGNTMFRAPRIFRATSLLTLFVVSSVMAQAVPDTAVIDTTSSGLLTFSTEDKAIRVAAVFVQPDDAVIPTIVRFVDSRGRILKQRRSDLRDGAPIIVELTRAEVGTSGELLVRVEVVHRLPGVREARYPIVVTTQPIAISGMGRLVLTWNGGICGEPIPPGTKPGSSTGSGVWAQCAPPTLTDL
jgi:hypothetical protein